MKKLMSTMIVTEGNCLLGMCDNHDDGNDDDVIDDVSCHGGVTPYCYERLQLEHDKNSHESN